MNAENLQMVDTAQAPHLLSDHLRQRMFSKRAMQLDIATTPSDQDDLDALVRNARESAFGFNAVAQR